MNRPSPFVILNNVDKIYPPKQLALKNVSLRINRGEFIFVAGSSGAGKSTFLKLLFAEQRATRGSVFVDSHDLGKMNSEDISRYRRKLGIIFQDYKLLPTWTVQENVSFTLEVVGVRYKEREYLAKNILKAVGLEDRLNDYPMMLSGGEQQRVAIARALVHRPSLIIADEPSGNLDPDMSKVVFDLLLEANSLGTTVLVATHDLAMIEKLNKRTIVLDKGKLEGDFQYPRGR